MMMKLSHYSHLLLDFGAVDVHTDQKFNFTVKPEFLDEAALTTAEVQHLWRTKTGRQEDRRTGGQV